MTAPVVSSSVLARRVRNGAVLLAVLAAVYALLGFLVLPLLLKPRLEAQATEMLGRRTTLGRLEFNPFTLRAHLRDFAIAGRDPQRAFLRFETLDVDVSPASLRYLAPVLDAVHLVRPRVEIARNDDGSYSIDDVVERLSARPAGPTPEFSVSNIEVDDGSVTLDDRPHSHKIVVSGLGIGIPFLSSIPHDARIRVAPRLEGRVDGARFALAGNATSPFAEAQKATLGWNLDALPLARYAEYVALPSALKLTDGALTTRLTLEFASEKGVPRSVSLSGTARIDAAKLARSDGSPVAAASSIEVAVSNLDFLAHSIALSRVAVTAPAVDVRRDEKGAFEFVDAFTTPRPEATRTPRSVPPPQPWRYSVADARISHGMLRFGDASVAPRFETTLSNIDMTGTELASSGAPGSVDLQFDEDHGAHFAMTGRADVANFAATGHFALTKLDVARLHPYYAPMVDADVKHGVLDIAGNFDIATEAGAMRVKLAAGSAALADFDAAREGERDPFLRVGRLEITGVSADVSKRDVAIESVQWRNGALRVLRQRDGTFVPGRLMKPAPRDGDTARRRDHESRDGASGGGTDDAAWSIRVGRMTVERIAADFEDRSQQPAVRVRLPDVRIVLADIANAPHHKTTLDADVRVGAAGRVRLRGNFATDASAADMRVDARRVDLVPLRPYFEPRTNIVLTSGTVTARGHVVIATARDGSSTDRYKGDLTFSDFATLDRPNSQELVRWKTLALTGIDATREPLDVAIGAIAMNGFYARLILNDDATLNLKQLLTAPEAASAGADKAAPPATVSGVTTKTLPPGRESGALPLSIGRIALDDGEVQYSDFFVKPNYTAHLTDVSGSVSALSATQAGTVELTARVEGSAPVDVRGTVNPFASELALDLTGKASNVDLPPLTPYSVKYAGYGIEKGKLALEVHYRIDDRKLAATNKLRLDQLTFGEHVDSPTATKLPVLLAVSLLKDRNGVINLDLPIEGTLDDPQFSVWHVLVQIVTNLITKAVTAPFALLASIAGGGGEQLAYVEFGPGHADLPDASRTKLATLAKALVDRPGLEIDASGRASGDVDRDGLKHAMLDRALRAQRAKALAAKGESATPPDAPAIAGAEYPKLLSAVYRDTDLPDKPRNFLGIAKTLPPAEMEARLLASYRVDDAALTALANLRAEAVKQWFEGDGGIAAKRIFVVAAKLGADGMKDSGSPARVDFAIH